MYKYPGKLVFFNEFKEYGEEFKEEAFEAFKVGIKIVFEESVNGFSKHLDKGDFAF